MTRDAEHAPTGYEDAASVVVNQAPAPSSLAGGEKHYGDPCIRCGVGHDNVPPGPCRGDGITISRERARAVLDYLKNGRGPAGWPTQLWVEVQHFIANIEAALTPRHEAPASPTERELELLDAVMRAGGIVKTAAALPDKAAHLSLLTDALNRADAILTEGLNGAPVRHEAPAEGAGELDDDGDVPWPDTDLANALHKHFSELHGLTNEDASDEVHGVLDVINALRARSSAPEAREPVPVTIFCPQCALPHVDEGEWATTRQHKTHQCQGCGHEWRPFPFATVGVTHPTAPSADKLRTALSEIRDGMVASRDCISVDDWIELADEALSTPDALKGDVK